MPRSARVIASPPGHNLTQESATGASLSARQQEILSLLSQGKSNKEIGHMLGLTTGTVKQHIYALFRKLGVRNRTMAAVRGAQATKSVVPAGAGREPQDTPIATGSSQPVPEETHYTRRLVTAVAIEPRPRQSGASSDPADSARQTNWLRERAGNLAFYFDARFEPLPGGGAAVWFGQPVAHGDDAARAVAFVRALTSSGDSGQCADCSIGIGTVPEIVGYDQRSSLAFRAFRVAMLLSTFGEPGAPLAWRANEPYPRIPVPWRTATCPSRRVPLVRNARRRPRSPGAGAACHSSRNSNPPRDVAGAIGSQSSPGRLRTERG